jgi:hypothetical protein
VPDVGDDGDGRPLQRQAERGRVGGDGDVQRAGALALSEGGLSAPNLDWEIDRYICTHLCAPEAEHDGAAGAVAHLLGEQAGVRVVLAKSMSCTKHVIAST